MWRTRIPAPTHTCRARRFYEGPLAQRQDLPMDDARHAHPAYESDYHDDDGDARREDGDEGDAEQEHREGQHHVSEAHDQRPDEAAIVPGHRAERHADEHGDRVGRDPDQQRNARPR